MAGGREHLMEAAERLFADAGYSATGVRHICSAAGVTQPTLYHFFGSKEKLLLELIQDRYNAYGAGMDEVLGQADDPEEMLERYVTFIIGGMTERPLTAKFLFGILFGPQQDIPKAALHPIIGRHEKLLNRHLRRTAPDVDRRRIDFVAVSVYGMIAPAVLQFLTYGIDQFPRNMATVLASRAAAILNDDGPIFNWPSGADS